MSDFDVHRHHQLGVGGEFTAHFLSLFGSQWEVPAPMRHPGANSALLGDQVEAWMSEISPGLRLHYTPHPTMDLVNLRVSFSSTGAVSTNEYRPTNVGFGVTYALPVVVALLSGRSNGLVLLENPEAHLHPKAQVKIGQLIALAAAAGIQVIFETHSDHILNGIRVAVRQGLLMASKTRLYFFSRVAAGETPSSRIISPSLNNDGRVDAWPDGFFDETERTLEQLL
jgi:predicted ATPase